MNRWEWLESMKPESTIAVAVKYMVKHIVDDLAAWPPQVVDQQGATPSRFADILARGSAKPAISAYREALKRVRWELTRDYDAINFYERNHHLKKACPDQRDQLASEFIQHYILESFYTLMERTDYRVKRPDVLVGVELLDKRWNAEWSVQ